MWAVEDLLWSDYQIKENSIYEVEKVLKRRKSWSEDIVQLGDISGTMIEVLVVHCQSE